MVANVLNVLGSIRHSIFFFHGRTLSQFKPPSGEVSAVG
jgi:hypothetical protein